jgi:hypothetical protein
MLWFRSFLMALPLIALSGCVQLQAVTDYAASAGDVLADKAPVTRWHDSETRLLALRLEGDQCSIGRSGRPPQATFDAAFTQAVGVHDTLGQYFHALGELASDRQPPSPAQTLNGSLAQIKHAGVAVDAADENALRSLANLLSRSMDGYRHEKIRLLMQTSHEDVDRLIHLLQRLGTLYRDEVNGERIQAVQFLRCSVASGDISDKFWGRREIQRMQRAYQTELTSLDRYLAALAQVGRDHEAMRQALSLNGAQLTQALQGISTTGRQELEAARAALQTLQGTPP